MKAMQVLTLSTCLLAACTHQARKPAGATATITEAGSTNSPAWTITVAADGSATLAVENTRKGFTLPETSAAKFFADLAASRALGPHAPVHCPKSASFREFLTVSTEDWASPDLSCPIPEGGPLADLAQDLQTIEKISDVRTVIMDIQFPPHQQPANLPHCKTPDGKYEIDIGMVSGSNRFFAIINELPRRNGAAFDSYEVTGASPFNGQGSHLNRFSHAEPFSLTLANTDYERDTDASLDASLIDQSTDNDGKSVGTPAVTLHYPHLTCTRFYR